MTIDTILRQKGTEVATIEPEASVSRAAVARKEHRRSHCATGIISIGDVVKHRLEDLESETNVLRDAHMARR